MLAGVAQEREQIDRAEPVGVVRRSAPDCATPSKSRKRSSCALDAGDVRRRSAPATAACAPATCRSDRRSCRCRRPTIAIGEWPNALQPRQAHHRQQRSDVKTRRGRVETDVGRDALLREHVGQAFGRVVHHVRATRTRLKRVVIDVSWGRPASCDGGTPDAEAAKRFTIAAYGDDPPRGPQRRSSSRRRRRDRRNRAHGYLYGRHELDVTRRRLLPVNGLPPALVRAAHRPASTDVHRSRWMSDDDVARAVNMLLIASVPISSSSAATTSPGVTVSTSIPSAEALAPSVGAARRVRHPRQPRRRPSDAGRAGARTASRCSKTRDTRLTHQRRSRSISWASGSGPRRRAISRRSIAAPWAPMTILLAHDPRRLTEAAALNMPLVLSGHTHGGQVVLPVVGAIAAQKFPDRRRRRPARSNRPSSSVAGSGRCTFR